MTKRISSNVFNENTKLWEVVIVEVATTHEQSIKDQVNTLNVLISNKRNQLNELDKKVLKYKEQLELVNDGLMTQTEKTKEEYIQYLIDKQNLREEIRIHKADIYNLLNPILNTEEVTPHE